MDTSQVPYLIFSREVEGMGRVYVCLCLIDHMVFGIAATREGALFQMTDEANKKYPEKETITYGGS